MKICFSSSLTLASVILRTATAAVSTSPQSLRGGEQEGQPRNLQGPPEGVPPGLAKKVECVLYEEHLLYPEGVDPPAELPEDERFICQDSDFLVFKVKGLPPGWVKANQVASGESTLVANAAVKNLNVPSGDFIAVDAGKGFSVEGRGKNKRDLLEHRRRLSTGTKSMIILRAVPLDVQSEHSKETMAQNVFDNPNDAVNLESQMLACSGGQLHFTPATGENIVNGAADIPIAYSVTGVSRTTVHNYVINAAPDVVGSLSQWDFRFVVLPNQVDFAGAAAYAYVPGTLSVYRDDYYWRAVVQVHELGHNLGLYHSGQGTATYLDHSCNMGNPNYSDDWQQCFNGAKSYFLGWYTNTDISGTYSWEGKLVGVNDYNNGETTPGQHQVAVRIDNTASTTDLYLLYQRKEGVNKDVKAEYANKVTVVEAVNNSRSQQSWLLASLDAGQVYRQPNFSNSGSDLVVEVCELVEGTPDFARTLVYLDNGVDNLSCETPTGAPVAPPTAAPVAPPTAAPVVVPTAAPVAPPTAAPVAPPTAAPVAPPTAAPVAPPTAAPVAPPTATPVAPPTAAPVAPPTAAPVAPPITQCLGNKASCLVNTECCSLNCNRGTCRGN